MKSNLLGTNTWVEESEGKEMGNFQNKVMVQYIDVVLPKGKKSVFL